MSDQVSLAEWLGPAVDPESSRFIRTTWMLDVKVPLSLESCAATLRFLDDDEAARLEDLTRRKNVIRERSFYARRMREMAGQSVIEVWRAGQPREIANEARKVAEVAEVAALVSTALYMSRKEFHRAVGVTAHRKDVIDFIIGPEFRRLSSSSRRERPVKGIVIDSRFAKRCERVGLEAVVTVACGSDNLSTRLYQALRWLAESRFEHSLAAGVVKASIALESLLGASSTEPLRRSLSERAAFLLGTTPEEREQISRIVKQFYDVRSRIVHGSSRSTRVSTTGLLGATERLAVLCVLTLAANARQFGTSDVLIKWTEDQRWGRASTLDRPFRDGDLKRAVALSEK